jgi:hypothetical protein
MISLSVELNATVTPIPVTGSALLAFFGVGLRDNPEMKVLDYKVYSFLR